MNLDERIKISESCADELLAMVIPANLVIDRDKLLQLIDDLLSAGRKLYAIKIVRMLLSCGLLAAKTIVDIREEKQRIKKERDFNAVKEDSIHGHQVQHNRNRDKDLDFPI